MDSQFCVDALEEAIYRYGKPEIFNSDQGSQFTSEAFTSVLKSHQIQISMDGRGAWRDKGYVSHCTSLVRFGTTSVKRRRCASFWPWALTGGSSPGCSVNGQVY